MKSKTVHNKLWVVRMKRAIKRLSLPILLLATTVVVIITKVSPSVSVLHLRQLAGDDKGEYSRHNYLQTGVDIQSNGVLVVLDIPQAGMASLSNFMVQNTVTDSPCQCPPGRTKCKCLNRHGEHWLFHSYNTTRFVCGEYADFSTLAKCPIDHWFQTSGKDTRPYRRYFLIVMLREPESRYTSEWLATRSEDTFFRNEPRLYRNTSLELQKKGGLSCYLGKKIANLTLTDFLTCRENPANNRQTWMLANLSDVNIRGLTGKDYDDAILASAKNNLMNLPFFGLFDRPTHTQLLLETQLGLQFNKALKFEDPDTDSTVAALSPALRHDVVQINNLDAQLYQFAKELFNQRVKEAGEGKSNRGVSNDALVDDFRIIYRPDLKDVVDNFQNDVTVVEDLRKDENEDHDDNGEDILDSLNEKIRAEEVFADERMDVVRSSLKAHINIPIERDDRHLGDATIEDDNVNEDYEEDAGAEKEHTVLTAGSHTNEGVGVGIVSPEKSQEKLIQVDNKAQDRLSGSEKVEHDIPRYQTDVEDVSVFLERLEKLKQQKTQSTPKRSAQQLSPTRSNLMPNQAEKLTGVIANIKQKQTAKNKDKLPNKALSLQKSYGDPLFNVNPQPYPGKRENFAPTNSNTDDDISPRNLSRDTLRESKKFPRNKNINRDWNKIRRVFV